MKPVLQAVLFLGLTMPAFSAAPEVDFDGANPHSLNIQEVINNSEVAMIPPTPQMERDLSEDVGTIKVEVAVKYASGEWVVQDPEKINDTTFR